MGSPAAWKGWESTDDKRLIFLRTSRRLAKRSRVGACDIISANQSDGVSQGNAIRN